MEDESQAEKERRIDLQARTPGARQGERGTSVRARNDVALVDPLEERALSRLLELLEDRRAGLWHFASGAGETHRHRAVDHWRNRLSRALHYHRTRFRRRQDSHRRGIGVIGKDNSSDEDTANSQAKSAREDGFASEGGPKLLKPGSFFEQALQPGFVPDFSGADTGNDIEREVFEITRGRLLVAFQGQ